MIGEAVTSGSSALVTVLVAAIPVAGTVLGTFILRGQNRIHTLVNSNLQAVKDQVAALEIQLEKMTTQRDNAVAVSDKVVAASDATGEALQAVRDQHK